VATFVAAEDGHFEHNVFLVQVDKPLGDTTGCRLTGAAAPPGRGVRVTVNHPPGRRPSFLHRIPS